MQESLMLDDTTGPASRKGPASETTSESEAAAEVNQG